MNRKPEVVHEEDICSPETSVVGLNNVVLAHKQEVEEEEVEIFTRFERSFEFTRFECSFEFTRFECSFEFTRFEWSFEFTRFECSFPFTRFKCSLKYEEDFESESDHQPVLTKVLQIAPKATAIKRDVETYSRIYVLETFRNLQSYLRSRDL